MKKQALYQNSPPKAGHKRYPIDAISARLLTAKGACAVRADQSIKEQTLKKLFETEAKLIPEKYQYVLAPHDPGTMVKQVFHDNEDTGFAHIASLIEEDTNQTLANVIAAFAMNKNVPFLVCAIWVLELKQIEGLHYYKHGYGGYTLVKWNPPVQRSAPYLNTSKLAAANKSSIDGLNDNYVIATFEMCGRNKTTAASMLNISTVTLTKRLKSVGYLLEDGSIRENYKEYAESLIMNKRDKALENSTDVGTDKPIPRKTPQAANNEDSEGATDTTSEKCDVSDDDIIKSFCEAGYIRDVAADICGVNRAWYKEKLAQAMKAKGISTQTLKSMETTNSDLQMFNEADSNI